jgi:hypothetical protein
MNNSKNRFVSLSRAPKFINAYLLSIDSHLLAESNYLVGLIILCYLPFAVRRRVRKMISKQQKSPSSPPAAADGSPEAGEGSRARRVVPDEGAAGAYLGDVSPAGKRARILPIGNRDDGSPRRPSGDDVLPTSFGARDGDPMSHAARGLFEQLHGSSAWMSHGMMAPGMLGGPRLPPPGMDMRRASPTSPAAPPVSRSFGASASGALPEVRPCPVSLMSFTVLGRTAIF